MKTVRLSATAGAAILLIFLLAACAAKPLDPWAEFMHGVLESARADDYDALTRDLTLYRWEEILEFFRQSSAIEITRGGGQPAEEQLYAAMHEDVQMFVRSYEDLFDGRPVKVSTKPLEIDGVECYSVILWVKKYATYNGILIHAVWTRPTGIKVLEWVDTAPAAAAGVELRQKRARLSVRDPALCVLPERIEFQQVLP